MSFLQYILILFILILINENNSSTTIMESTTQSIYEEVFAAVSKIGNDMKRDEEQLKIDREKLEEEMKQIQKSIKITDVISLNIGGEIIMTTRETLTRIPKSILSMMFNGRWENKLQIDQNGNIFFDFNPILFRHLLDQLQISDSNNLIHLYPPSQPSLVKPFQKMIHKLGLHQELSLEKKIIYFNVDGHIITNHRTTFNEISNSTFDTIVPSYNNTKSDDQSDAFVDYHPKLFRHLVKKLREKPVKNIGWLAAPSYKDEILFKRMLNDFNICLYVPTYRIITNPSDTVMAIYNATAGGPSLNSSPGSGVGQYVASQGPTVCIDFSSSTCLNFGNSGWNASAISNIAGVGTGLYTIPIVGVSIVRSIQFQAGADVPNRDPLTITLEGSNATGSALSLGSVWTLLYSGVTGLAPYNVTRSVWGDMQNFTNTRPFTAYRMLVTSQRGADICTQFAEMHLFGLY